VKRRIAKQRKKAKLVEVRTLTPFEPCSTALVCIAKATVGRPVTSTDPESKAAKRRKRRHEAELLERTSGIKATPNRVGRPRAQEPENFKRAADKRVLRQFEMVTNITKTAGAASALLFRRNKESFCEAFPERPGAATADMKLLRSDKESSYDAFVESPCSSFVAMTRHMSATPQGAKLLPDMAKVVGEQILMEEVGRGTIDMIKQVGKKPKVAITVMVSKHVSDMARFCSAVGTTMKEFQRVRKGFVIPKCLMVNYDLLDFRSYAKPSCDRLTKLVECFFLRMSNCRSGQRDQKRTIFRELPHKLKDINIIWFSEFPEYCREAALKWPVWYNSLKPKKRLTQFQASVLWAVQNDPGEDLHIEIAERVAEATVEYSRQLLHARLRWRGSDVTKCNSRTTPAEHDIQAAEYTLKQDLLVKEAFEDIQASALPETACVVAGDNGEPLVVTVPNIKLVFKIVKQLGYSWTQNVYPTECPIHDEGPAAKIEFDKAHTHTHTPTHNHTSP
jgi:hypothetical protein